MLSIDRLAIRLPPGYEHRADRIAELVAQRLRDVAVQSSEFVPHVRVDGVTVEAGHSDTDVAAKIAAAIQRGLPSSDGAGGTGGDDRC